MTGLTVPSREYWTLGTTVQTRFPATWTQAGTTLQASVSMLVNRFDLGENFQYALHSGECMLPRQGLRIRVGLRQPGRRAPATAGYSRRNGQLGVDSPIFVGEMYLHSAFELRRLYPDLAAHFHGS